MFGMGVVMVGVFSQHNTPILSFIQSHVGSLSHKLLVVITIRPPAVNMVRRSETRLARGAIGPNLIAGPM